MILVYNIRESGLLENPHEELPLISINEKILHPDLVNFYFQCKDNYSACKWFWMRVSETTGQLQKCKINAKN